jgi:hypothetical protein
VDLSFYGHEQQLEYDFVVSPGADPGAIRLSFAGAKNIYIDREGNLVVGLGKHREVVFHKPVVYQPAKKQSGGKELLDGEYVLEAGNRVRFRVEGVDPARSLVIDPMLSFATYLGGTGNEFATAIAVDSAQNVYVAGATSSTDFPTTTGAFQTTNKAPGSPGYPASNPSSATFVTKLNPTGTALIYSTYLSGSAPSYPAGTAMAVDSSGNAYITGSTGGASDFPVTPGAYQTSPGGGFVSKLNASGSALVYSTYLGPNVSPKAIALDSSGNAYVAGSGAGRAFPTTAGAFQSPCTLNSTAGCAFVIKLNANGSALVYSIVLGGSGASNDGDFAYGIAVDSLGEAFVTGNAASPDFPTTPGAFQTVNTAGWAGPGSGYYTGSAFVTKLNPTGSALVYSTFIGGELVNVGNAIVVDSAGSAYITGATRSSDFPVTPGAFQTQFAGQEGAFVSKFNASGSALEYSSFLGTSYFSMSSSGGTAIALDSSGHAFVSGETNASDFPLKDPLVSARNKLQYVCGRI